MRKFDKNNIINELLDIISFYEEHELLKNVDFSYRIKALQSCMLKYNKYYPNTEMNRCFNDMLGIRVISDYEDVFKQDLTTFKIADMRNGKAFDDGYRGVHLYFKNNNKSYPIEIQINSKKDRVFNDWLHIYLYKYTDDTSIGKILREKYDTGIIQNEADFKEELSNVLSHSKEI